MRYITVPPLVTLTSLAGEILRDERGDAACVSFKQFALSRLLDSAFARQGMAGAVATLAIREQLLRSEPGEALAIDDSHWELLSQVTSKPSPHAAGVLDPYYAPAILHNMVPYMKAICEAADETAFLGLNDVPATGCIR